MKPKFYHFLILGSIVFLLDILKPLEYNDWIVYCFLTGLASKCCKGTDLYKLALIFSVFIISAFLLADNYETQAVQTHMRGIIMLWFLTYLLVKLRSEQMSEKKLREEQDKIYNRIDDIIFGVDRNWNVTYKNAAADKMGYDFIKTGENFFEKMPKTIGTSLEKHFKLAMDTQKPVTFTYETQYSRVPRFVIFTAYPSEEGLSVFTKDITELRKAEEKIQEADRRLASIINRIDDAFWAVDRDFNIIYANDIMVKWTGKKRDELIGKNLWDTLPLLKNSIVEQKFREAIAQQQSLKFEMKSIYIPNTYFSISVSPSEEGLTIYAQDISDYKDAKINLQQALDEKNFLFRELNHRVKNSLQMVSSIINLEMENIQDNKVQAVMQDIIKRIKSISLVHSKLHETESLSHLNLAEYISEVVKYLIRSYERPDVKVKMDLNEVVVDVKLATPIGIIVNELVSNSIKYACKKGSGCQIEVVCKSVNNRVTLIVRDNGSGYPSSAETFETLGIQLIRHFADQLDAELIMENRNGAYNEISFQTQMNEIQSHL